ncbi:MAG: Mur ligase family protein [Candidatus Limnocylindrales bacterium]
MATDALARIRSRGHIGIRLGLGRMQALLDHLGQPQRALRGVLIAGTNGKGSVAAIVGAVLASAGYSTAASPSPHLHSYRERVTVDGTPIGRAELDLLLEEVLAASVPGEAAFGPATEFELLTAAAYLQAARVDVDVMVMEVGLGGRLDASNTWDPDVAAVTHVGLDHQEFLGDTIESVAAEKAAIIKPGTLAVTGAEGPALEVIRARAAQVGVPLTECAALPVEAMDRDGLALRHDGLGVLRLPLLGTHQASNAAVALGVLEALHVAGVAAVSRHHIREGFSTVRWPGRLELLEHQGQTVLLDGAHNPDGMAVLARTVDTLAHQLPSGPATLLLGVMRDKDVGEMLRALTGSPLLRAAGCIATSVPGTDRALPADALAAHWSAIVGTAAEAQPDAGAALERALERARSVDGPLVVAGSLYLVGELRARLVPGTISDDA